MLKYCKLQYLFLASINMCILYILFVEYIDLVELMMMQNAQMHQVIMSNMTMSALSTFGYTCSPEHLGPPVAAEDDAEVFHHYYPYNPALSHSVWMPPLTGPQIPQLQTIPSFHHPSDPLHTAHTQHRERSQENHAKS
uniref:DUF4587 domain-containing protein n=1 Tax=Astyanax mexicanus TaxID=7994 RepID=A0A8B9HD35_ASTMX